MAETVIQLDVADVAHIVCRKGDTAEFTLNFPAGINLTDATFQAKVCPDRYGSEPVITLSSTGDNPAITSVGQAVKIRISGNDTANVPKTGSLSQETIAYKYAYVWDFKVTYPGGKVTTHAYGNFVLQ